MSAISAHSERRTQPIHLRIQMRLIIIASIMRMVLITLIGLLLLGNATTGVAGPSDYVFLPGVTYGEREIDFKTGSWRHPGDGNLTAASLGFGYGVTQYWFTEIYRKYEHPGGEATRFDAWEWENKFQLTEPGRYPLDVGFIVEIERPQDRSEGYEALLGPLFQTELGKFQLNANVLLSRHFRAATEQHTELGYQWQIKYRWKPQFEFGAQAFGEVGRWDHWAVANEQSHRLGPAVFGKLALGNRQAIRYNAAWLVGTSDNSPKQTFRAQVEYEF